jgi:hypothetical protein
LGEVNTTKMDKNTNDRVNAKEAVGSGSVSHESRRGQKVAGAATNSKRESGFDQTKFERTAS